MQRATASVLGLSAALVLAVGSVDPSAFEEVADAVDAAGEPMCPDGTEVAEFWQGEYPMPVVRVTEEVSLPAAADPCAPLVEECVVPAGLYHPWSREGAVGFATVVEVTRFEARGPTTIMVEGESGGEEAVSLDAGDVVEVPAYHAEGYCGLRVKGRETSGLCPEHSGADLEELPSQGLADRQLFQVACANGGQYWIEVDEGLMARPELTEGEILEYGRVGPDGGEGVF